MKKYILIAALLLGASYASAEQVPSPTGPQQALASADYGGVFIATSQWSASITTVVAQGQGVVYGVWFSSSVVGDFVDVFDSTSAPNTLATRRSSLILRIHNVEGSTATANEANVVSASGFRGPPYPVRFGKGLYFQPSTPNFVSAGLLYYKKP